MIGVIGGNGVAATNKLCQLVEEKRTKVGAFRDSHHPEMLVWYATQEPSRSMFLEGRGPSFIDGYVRISRLLEDCGCTELCMCCNTAHFAIDKLRENVNIPIISILELVAKRSSSLGYKKVGMMCTDGLRKVGLYNKVFEEVDPTIELIYPDEGMQTLVTKCICNAKNINRYLSEEDEENPVNCIKRCCENLRIKGVDCIVGGCTDIGTVYLPETYKGIGYIDSLETLADYIHNSKH